MLLELRRNSLAPVQLAVRASVAAGVALVIADLVKLQYPLFSLIAAVIATDLSPRQSRKLGLIRLAATLVGAICGAALGPVLPPGPIAVGVAIFITMLLCTAVRVSDGSRVAGYICAIVVFDHSSAPWSYAGFRLVETALGVIVAWLVSYIPKLIATDQPEESSD